MNEAIHSIGPMQITDAIAEAYVEDRVRYVARKSREHLADQADAVGLTRAGVIAAGASVLVGAVAAAYDGESLTKTEIEALREGCLGAVERGLRRLLELER